MRSKLQTIDQILELSIEQNYPHAKRNELEKTARSFVNQLLIEINNLEIESKGLDGIPF